MPRTKLGMAVQRRKEQYKKRIDTRIANTIAQCDEPTWKDYRELCDYLFETWIRYRDGWKCPLTGKTYAEGDYEHYHACHFIGRRCLATRYLPENCHGQSSWLNYQQSLGNVKVIDEYLQFMRVTYGQDTINRLYVLAKGNVRWTMNQWRSKLTELWNQMLSIPNGQQIMEKRFETLYTTTKRRYALERMLTIAGGNVNGQGFSSDHNRD